MLRIHGLGGLYIVGEGRTLSGTVTRVLRDHPADWWVPRARVKVPLHDLIRQLPGLVSHWGTRFILLAGGGVWPGRELHLGPELLATGDMDAAMLPAVMVKLTAA
jgi:hypothetical protein